MQIGSKKSKLLNGRVPPFRSGRERGRLRPEVVSGHLRPKKNSETGACLRSGVRERGRLRPENRRWALASQGDGLRPVVRERALASLVIVFQNRALCPNIFRVVAGGFEIRPMRFEQRIVNKSILGAPFVTSNIHTLLRSRLVVGRYEKLRTGIKRNMLNTRSLHKHN